MPKIDARSLFSPTVLLAVALMTVIVMMILPMPAWVLDVGLAASFALAILIFTLTLFIERPLDFSSFPTILLASLMLRLSLNVSSTKLIIGQGHTGPNAAGDVIEGFANFVMGGSIFLGLVVFGVLLIVNFMVITKGAARMAEVGARFALDGMPGKQLAIDSDMSAGAIDHQQAKERREREQQETTFFGSLDGASKFVKGDAIAGLLITLLNLVMGLIMGVIVHGMPVASAFETYAILTVGDGLVSQIPAAQFTIRDELAVEAQLQLDTVARDLIERFETPRLDPTALATDPGLFTDDGNRFDPTAFVGLASRVSVNASVDPNMGGDSWKLRAGLGAVTAGDPGQSAQLRAFGNILKDARPVAGGLFGTGNMRAAELTEALLSKAGTNAHVADQRQTFANTAQQQMAQIEAEQGVDTDQELQRLMQVEQTYAANARVISVVDELLETLLRL